MKRRKKRLKFQEQNPAEKKVKGPFSHKYLFIISIFLIGNVKWKLGLDGEPWVWIMGDHPNDPTIDEIIEREALEKARLLAEKETEELR